MRKCEKARDFNSGSVLSNILYFSLPYLPSYFLQTLYGMADLLSSVSLTERQPPRRCLWEAR